MLGVFNNFVLKSRAIKLGQADDNTVYEKRDFNLNQIYSFAQTDAEHLEDYLYSDNVEPEKAFNDNFSLYYDEGDD